MITGNESIYPIVTEERTSSYSNWPNTMLNNVQNEGITIYSAFAMSAMQGFLSNSNTMTSADIDHAVTMSVTIAKQLIDELNKRPII
jgi:hypothetical protein